MKLFWLLWSINGVVTAVLVYYFLIGIGDSTVSLDNLGLWALLLFVSIGLLIGTYFLKIAGYILISKILLSLVAVPALVALFLLIMASNSHWN